MPSAHGIPVHVVQGRTDPFGTPAEVEAVLPPGATLDVVTGAHSIGGSAAAVAALVVQRLRDRLTSGARRRGMPSPEGTLTDLSAAAPGKVTPSCSCSTPQPPAGPG